MGHVGTNEYRVVRLRDGRALCYAQYGAPEGFPVINAHGGLACRLDVAAADSAAREAGVRLISPDRPGIGGSDPKPGRTILEWADDVEELTTLLAIESFAVMGWSMGGQYAAAVGHALTSQTRRVAIIAGALPLTEPGIFAHLPAFDRYYTRWSQHSPMLARSCFGLMATSARLAPSWYGRLAARQLGSADAEVLRAEGFSTFAQMSAEALRNTDGVAEDYRAWIRPWGFKPEDLAVPVDVWAGEQDQLIDSHWPAELARRIPGARLLRRPGGHFLAHLHFREILDRLSA